MVGGLFKRLEDLIDVCDVMQTIRKKDSILFLL